MNQFSGMTFNKFSVQMLTVQPAGNSDVALFDTVEVEKVHLLDVEWFCRSSSMYYKLMHILVCTAASALYFSSVSTCMARIDCLC